MAAMTEPLKCAPGVAMTMVLATLGLFPGVALACVQGEELVFVCTTTKGKRVQVCETRTDFSYSYGKPGVKPELSLRVPRNKVSYDNSQGASGYSVVLGIPNGQYTYSVSHVWFATDGATGALSVTRGDELIAEQTCKAEGWRDRLAELKLPEGTAAP